MDFWLAVVSRWLHIGSVIILVGGAFFLRFAVAPAAAELTDSEHDKLRQGILQRWKKFVHAIAALIIATGLYNYIQVTGPLHKGDKVYHILVGSKALLGVFAVGLASMLVGRSSFAASLRKDAKKWLVVNLLMAAVIIAISGYVKVRGTPAAVIKPAVETESKP